ncbi:MAG: hypothetical protein RL011_2258 [Pseudomonadota bacterium]|jgi:hypothetical protein
MSGVFQASFLAIMMTVAACSSNEAATPPVAKKEKDSGGEGQVKLDNPDSGGKDKKNPSAFHIRQNRKQTIELELGLLESDLQTATQNYNTLRSQKYSTLDKGIAGVNDKTVQGSLVSAGTSFLFGGLGMALGGIGGGSAGSQIDSETGAAAARGTSGGAGGGISTSGLSGLTKGFSYVGDAISTGITKAENEKTIKRITGTVEEMMMQWQVEMDNIQAQIDAKNAELVSLVNMGI